MLALVLAYNPVLVYSTGFQLSVAAVFGILLLTRPLKSLVERTLFRPFTKPPAQLVNLISVSMAAQIATSPIVAATFDEVSIVGVFTNLIAVPLSGPILILGLLGSLAGNIYPLLAYPLNACNGFLVTIFLQGRQVPLGRTPPPVDNNMARTSLLGQHVVPQQQAGKPTSRNAEKRSPKGRAC